MSFICFNTVYGKELLRVHTRLCAWVHEGGLNKWDLWLSAYWGELKGKHQAFRQVESTRIHRMKLGARGAFSLIKNSQSSTFINYSCSPKVLVEFHVRVMCVYYTDEQSFSLPVHLLCIFQKCFLVVSQTSLLFLLPLPLLRVPGPREEVCDST